MEHDEPNQRLPRLLSAISERPNLPSQVNSYCERSPEVFSVKWLQVRQRHSLPKVRSLFRLLL
jgi:hypothetical protein